ncbi:quaternary ammonium compound efflux SMR transporter SugE [Catenovulum sp. 2E275]|uniref:quaternary ammonium compound efflux SMR transporter SugE n=1 Tax=Catenovulum sp. 2E275 TaxID=2980497 RepID=UPI0021CF0617|nr:quaternary ammonium compound efflux SMR transporter SugE [Catenovulum sp. 2E275]MCU4674383.1 quaternary ammonium compound efflux SMR transporter SugE [Catenovulum sp. 2E275]
MSWFILVIAGVFEIIWALGLKYSDGFSKFTPSIITIVSLIFSLSLLSIAMRSLPFTTAYGIWVGIGTLGTVIAGILLFSEPLHFSKVLSLVLILIGVVGLKLSH